MNPLSGRTQSMSSYAGTEDDDLMHSRTSVNGTVMTAEQVAKHPARLECTFAKYRRGLLREKSLIKGK